MDSPSNSSNKQQIVTTVGVLVVVVVLVGAVVAFSGKKTQTAAIEATATTTPTSSTAATSAATAAKYKDGTYTATGTYSSPGGAESIDVSLTIAGGVVTDSTVTPHAASPNSSEYQTEFVNGYKTYVTGKSLDAIAVSRVSGSSLTSQGFNNALTQIKTKAAV